MFKDNVLLITGGTGSFGNAVLDRFSNSGFKEIRIFSRDEKKQDDMRHLYGDSKIKFIIGDVRDKSSIDSAMLGVDYVFHAAALKQVPSCEFFPLEAVKTNIIGTNNLLDSAMAHSVKRVVVLSTDKAVYPINAMGISKAMMEKIAVARSRESNNTIINVTRYGNVMASRGSVIPHFVNQIKNNQHLTVTDPKMTRFMMTLDDAVNLVLYSFTHGEPGEIFVQKAPAATIKTLAESLCLLFGYSTDKIKIIGTRHGEKLYEVLMSREEVAHAIDLGDYFKVPPDGRDLNYKLYTSMGESVISNLEDYNSHNTHRLDKDSLTKILQNLNYIKDELGINS